MSQSREHLRLSPVGSIWRKVYSGVVPPRELIAFQSTLWPSLADACSQGCWLPGTARLLQPESVPVAGEGPRAEHHRSCLCVPVTCTQKHPVQTALIGSAAGNVPEHGAGTGQAGQMRRGTMFWPHCDPCIQPYLASPVPALPFLWISISPPSQRLFGMNFCACPEQILTDA